MEKKIPLNKWPPGKLSLIAIKPQTEVSSVTRNNIQSQI